MFILAAAALLVVLAVLVRIVGRHDDGLVIAARGLLWVAVIFALIALVLAFETPAHAQPLVISQQAVLAPFMAPVIADRPQMTRPAPRWATTVAVLGPFADAWSSCWAMAQSGPLAQVVEGNAVHRWLFGTHVSCGELTGFKVLQGVLVGIGIHAVGQQDREKAIGSALMMATIHAVVSVRNVRAGRQAKQLNQGAK